MPACEGKKAFLARKATAQISLEHAFDRLRRIVRFHVAVKLAADRSVWPEATADKDVIALHSIALVVDRDLASEQADFADEMLRAGMMTAGEMDVDRCIECNTRFAPACNLLGVTLGVGCRKLAALVAGASHQPGADRVGIDRQTERFDFRLRGFDVVAGNT